MRHLMQSCNNRHLIMGLDDQAIVLDLESQTIQPLLAPSSSNDAPSAKDDDGAASSSNNTNNNSSSTIQAVAVMAIKGESSVYYAVARADKSLQVYRHSKDNKNTNNNESVTTPTVRYVTSKRVASLCFATVGEDMVVLIAGDFKGDAVAYSLQTCKIGQTTTTTNDAAASQNPSERLLLGHTASMLTHVQVVTTTSCSKDDNQQQQQSQQQQQQYLLTADRDEKIRCSHFPATHRIVGYGLGHEAYVTCLDVSMNGDTCVTGGGDGTLRVWSLSSSMQARGHIQCTRDDSDDKLLRPTKVVWMNHHQPTVAVIYDDSCVVDLFQLHTKQEELLFERRHRVTCPSQPLGLATGGPGRLVVLTAAAPFLRVYDQHHSSEDDGKQLEDVTDAWPLAAAWAKYYPALTQNEKPTTTSLLERDEFGRITMEKLNEVRGPIHTQPWNNSGRIDVARERNQRCKKRRRERN